MSADKVAGIAGAYGLAMILGALFFQHVVGVAPCEMCYWQRWPHEAAGVIGLSGFGLIAAGALDKKWGTTIAVLTLLAIALSGSIGLYQAGVEWKFLPGPSSCTGDRIVFKGLADLNTAPVVRCDVAAWRLFGLSLAGYNAIFSLGTAALGALLVLRRDLGEKILGVLLHRYGK